jgi:hypothetical protein
MQVVESTDVEAIETKGTLYSPSYIIISIKIQSRAGGLPQVTGVLA